MDIRVAKTAGFCFGVARAVDRAYQCAEEADKKYVTLGPIIHNAQVVLDLAAKGVEVIDSISGLEKDVTVIIRTHGVPKSVYTDLEERGIPYLDLTCPFVKKIHNIVESHHADGCQIVIIGDSRHPEVIGINGWCDNSAVIIENLEQAEALKPMPNKVCIVAQTTFNQNIYKKMIKYANYKEI